MKRGFVQISLSVLMTSAIFANAMSVSAASENPHTPANATTEAFSYDVLLSEMLFFDFGQDVFGTASISVTNNSPVGVVEVTGIKSGEMESGFELKPVENEEYWRKLPLNSKQIAIQYDGENVHDFYDGDLVETIIEIAPDSCEELTFNGWTGGFTDEQDNLKVDTLILMIGFKEADGSANDSKSVSTEDFFGDATESQNKMNDSIEDEELASNQSAESIFITSSSDALLSE